MVAFRLEMRHSALLPLSLLILGMRWFVRRALADRRIRLLGERRDGPDLDEFTEVATDDDDTVREAIARDVDDKPDRVAASVRSLLGRDSDAAS